jgi:hypothetical protein
MLRLRLCLGGLASGARLAAPVAAAGAVSSSPQQQPLSSSSSSSWPPRRPRAIVSHHHFFSTTGAPSPTTLPSAHMLPVTASDPSAVSSLDAAVDAYLSLSGDPVALLRQASAQDPSLVLAPILDAALHLLNTGVLPTAGSVRAAREAAAAAVRSGSCTPRERAAALFVEALAHGRWRFACQVLEAQLAREPTDVVLLRLAHDTYFFLGDSRNLRDGVGRCWPSWDPTMPGYGKVAGMMAFGAGECNALERAEELAMAALNTDPDDAWSLHAAVHVYETACRREDGERLLKETEQHWSAADLFARHIHWHWALFALATGTNGYRQALARYDMAISEPPDAPAHNVLALVDASALLWRLELQAHEETLFPSVRDHGVAPPSKIPDGVIPGRAKQGRAAVAALAAATAAHEAAMGEAARAGAGEDGVGGSGGGGGGGYPLTRWHSLAGNWVAALAPQETDSAADRLSPFNDVHACMALAAAGHWCGDAASAAKADALVVRMEKFAAGVAGAGAGAEDGGDAWLRALVDRCGYDLAAMGLADRGGHAHSSLQHRPRAGTGGLMVPAFPHLPLAAVHDARAVTALVGLDMAKGVVAFARRDYGAAYAHLSRSRPHWQLTGGSHAQRDVFDQTLVHAAAACGELEAARALAAERTCVRPNDGMAWYIFASVLDKMGGAETTTAKQSEDCRNRAYLLGVNQGPGY